LPDRCGSAAGGVPADLIRSESFGPSAPTSAGGIMRHPPVGAEGDGPTVRFMRSGVSVRWTDTYVSLLKLSEACDVPARWSCRTGVCHDCECAIMDGELTSAIEPVDRPPDGRTLLCCTVPKSDVVLEL
jgi:ferredoxin